MAEQPVQCSIGQKMQLIGQTSIKDITNTNVEGSDSRDPDQFSVFLFCGIARLFIIKNWTH